MILGPTASGKSAAAMAVAQHLPVEIISMDSAQVYRGMDIGTAKPSASERSAVPHHLIDIIDPAQAYSAARFVTDADRLIEQIRQRNKTPLLVGGTMLYARALTEGLNNLPTANPDLRARLDNEARQEGWPAMHQKLARVDARTAARLKPTDSQRIQRALEVHALTGSPMSALLDAAPEHKSTQRFVRIALEPADRSVLHQRIAQRFDQMMAAGFVDEVLQLRLQKDLHPGLPSMRCVGYRQLWQWLDAGGKAGERHQAVQAGIAATRQLAKRQLTWLRSMTNRNVIACDDGNFVNQVSSAVLKTLNQ